MLLAWLALALFEFPEAKELGPKTSPALEIREVIGESGAGPYVVLPMIDPNDDPPHLEPTSFLDGEHLVCVRKTFDPQGVPVVALMFDELGRQRLEEKTAGRVEERVAIILDGRVSTVLTILGTARSGIIGAATYNQPAEVTVNQLRESYPGVSICSLEELNGRLQEFPDRLVE